MQICGRLVQRIDNMFFCKCHHSFRMRSAALKHNLCRVASRVKIVIKSGILLVITIIINIIIIIVIVVAFVVL